MTDLWKRKVVISPSLICLDMCNLESQVRQLELAGADVLHIDIIDGHFSPSLPMGLDVVRQLRRKTNIAFDVHLMAKEPSRFVPMLLDIGVQQLAFHIEEEGHVDEMLNVIHRAGVRAGVALKPATPLCSLDYVLDKCDVVLLMLINPGYASSSSERQVPYAMRKISELDGMIERRGTGTNIEIDGRISPDNIRTLSGTHTNIFVAGSTCIDSGDLCGSVSALMKL